VGQQINWHYGFGLAGIFMMAGLIVFYLGQSSLHHRGLPPHAEALKKPVFAGIPTEAAIYGATLLIIPVIVALFHQYELMDYIMFALGALSIGYILFIAMQLDAGARNKLFAALTLIIFSTLFWAFYEQNAGALNLFAMRNVDMQVGGTQLPALAVNNFLPPAWVIVLSFFFAWLWPVLNRKGLEPSTPLKFGISFLFLGLGFCVFYLGCLAAGDTGRISLLPFLMGYFFIICGELCLSPIGLSMITKLSPPKIVAMMMGIWFFASAIGEFLAGKIGSMMSVPPAVVNNPVLSLPYYADIISKIGIGSVGIGVILICFVPVIRKWMGGVH
jgi:POT family proton-dependent oligopeptide transporter